MIPDQVDASSVIVKGTWEDFVLEWEPVTNVNYGSLMYEVIIDNGSSKKAVLTSHNTVPYEGTLPPYSLLKVSVRGITDWSMGARLVKTLRTPATLPEAPQDLRTFVQKIQVCIS